MNDSLCAPLLPQARKGFWVQNNAGYYWTEEKVNRKLHAIMSREFNAVFERKERHGVSMRVAAYAHAMERIGAAIASKGTKTYFANDET